MIPDECASIRSMARWVLPVLVGPSTAVTPWPRATASREVTGEKDIGISGLGGGTRRPLVHCAHVLFGEPEPTPDHVRGRLSPGHAASLYHNATPGTAKSPR